MHKMDELDRRVFNGLKDAIRKTEKNIAEGNLFFNNFPVILIDFKEWDVHYFEDELDAEEHLKKKYSSWDDEPPSGEDEELIIFKYCDEEEKNRLQYTYKDYKFYKEINGKRIYKQKSFVEFEPELIINISI